MQLCYQNNEKGTYHSIKECMTMSSQMLRAFKKYPDCDKKRVANCKESSKKHPKSV